MASQITNIHLQLKDIIEIIAPSDTELHNKKYLIEYIDNYKIRLLSIEEQDNPILNLTIGSTGLLDKKSITEIILLSRDDKVGYARQNDLLPGTNVNIFFNTGEQLVVTGEITDLEEDMIEVTLTDNSIIYIDFAYKGIPDDIPIEKIVKIMKSGEAEQIAAIKASTVEKPSAEEETKQSGLGDELEQVQLQQTMDASVQGAVSAQQEPTRYGDLDVILEEDEYMGSQESLVDEEQEVAVESTMDNLQKIVLNADLVDFGPDLEDVKHMIELPEEQQRYDINTQINDIMNDLLSQYSLDKRSKKLMNSIHITIERYKQLREQYSLRNNEGVLTIPPPIQDDDKPLVHTLMHSKQPVDWILPVTKVKKILYNLRMDIVGEYNDVIHANNEMSILELNDTWDEYYGNGGSVQLNKYLTLTNKLSNYLNHTANDNNINHIYSVDIDNRQTYVVNNFLDFKCTTIFNNACERPPDKNMLGEVLHFIYNKSYYTSVYTGGQTYKEKNDVMSGDTLDIDSLMLLPYPYVVYSKSKLPKTSIKDRSRICNVYPSLYKILNKNTPLYTKTINTNTTYALPELKQLFGQINYMPPSDEIVSMENSEERYKTYLNKMLPSNNELLKTMLDKLEDALSYYEIIKRLEPYYIYEDNINNKFYLQIRDVLIKRVKANKIKYKERQRAFQRLTIKNKKGVNNEPLIHLVPKSVSDVLQMYFLNKDVNETSSEQLVRILTMDSGKLFNASILLDMIELHAVEKLDKTIQDKSLELSEKLLKTKKNCSKYVLVKKYTSIEQLETDQKKEIYVDKEYDKTKYTLLNEYNNEKESMELQEFMVFLVGKLIEKYNLTEEEAVFEARVILKGKRPVENDTYAVLITSEHGLSDNEFNVKFKGAEYYKRNSDQWVLDKSIDENVFALTSEDFCNTNDSCTYSTNDCMDVNTIKQQHNKTLINRIEEQLKHEYYLSKQDLEDSFKYNYNDSFRYHRILQQYENNMLYKYDLMKRKIAIDNDTGEDIVESPYKVLVDKVLAEGDITKKYEYIIEVVSQYTRMPNTGENIAWFYCKESNVPLLPMFYYKLASTYKNKDNYMKALNEVIVEYGVTVDNYIVDKYSGYVISSIAFNTEEGYTVEGFKEVTRGIITEEKQLVINNEGIKEDIPNTEETKMMLNIIHTLNSHMSVRLSIKDVSIVIMQSLQLFEGEIEKETEEEYNDKMARLERKGKIIVSYQDHKDLLLLLYTVTILFTVIQTKYTSDSIKKSVPGCLKSFSGYPLEIEDKDLKGLTYIACVVIKLKSSIRPWNMLRNMKIPSLVKKMKMIIDTQLIDTPYLRERRELFNEYLQKQTKFDGIPDSLDVKNWNHFIPPLYTYSIHQPDPIASHVKKNILVNKDGYSIVYYKMLQMCYRIMHSINTIVSTEVPHYVGEDGPYKDNACCDVSVLNYKPIIQYFAEKKTEIIKNVDSQSELSILLDGIVRPIKTMCMINDIGFPELPDTEIVLFSEELVYKTFIYFCKINKNIPIDPDLKMICIDNNSEYNEEDPIEVKIRKMKQEGKLYSIESFYQLMQVINSKNIIYLDTGFSDISRYHMLEEELSRLGESDNNTITMEIRESLKTLMDTFDVTIDSKTKEMTTIARLIKTETKKIERKILKLKTLGGLEPKEKKTIDKFISIVNGNIENNELSYINYVKRFIVDVCKHYPMRILNNVDFSSITISKHWKITSYNHKMDLQKAVADYYNPFISFYGNEDIENILNLIEEENTTLVRFMRSLPYFTSYTDENNVKFFHVLDEEIISNIYNYLLIRSFTIYLDNMSNVTSVHTVLSEDEDVRITLARKKTLQQQISKLLTMYMGEFVRHFEKTEPSYDQIIKRTMYAKEKEKIDLVKYMSDMSDEQRNAEQALRSTGQGRWATGQQKGYKEYQGSVYDEETKEARESTGAIDFTGEYMAEVEESGILSEFDEEADAYNMTSIMEDDDGEEGEYALSPIDNE